MAEETKTPKTNISLPDKPRIKLQREIPTAIVAGILMVAGFFLIDYLAVFTVTYQPLVLSVIADNEDTIIAELLTPPPPVLDTEAYDRKLLFLANNGLLELLDITTKTVVVASTTASSSEMKVETIIPPTSS